MNRANLAFGLAAAVLLLAGPEWSRAQSEAVPPAAVDGQEFPGVLRGLIDEQNRAKQVEDLDAVFKDVDLPERQQQALRRLFAQIFQTYDLAYATEQFKFLVRDGDVAIVRITERITKVDGPEFRDHHKELLQVFRRTDGRWKIHDQIILGVNMLTPEAQPAPAQQPSAAPVTQPPRTQGPADQQEPEAKKVPSFPVED